jgi:hypothetical protein
MPATTPVGDPRPAPPAALRCAPCGAALDESGTGLWENPAAGGPSSDTARYCDPSPDRLHHPARPAAGRPDLDPAREKISALNAKWAENDDWDTNSRAVLIQAGETELDTSDLSFDGTSEGMTKDLAALHKAFGVLLAVRDAGWDETITQLALDRSLCPVHFCDYAICFDDEDPGCEQVRAVHPAHDT